MTRACGSHPGAYERDQYFIASVSPRIWPFFGSVVRVRPVYQAMFPRWQRRLLLAPSLIGARSAAPLRMRVCEVLHVPQRGRIVADDIGRSGGASLFDVCLDDLSREVVQDVALAIQHETPLRPVGHGTAAAVEERLAVAALPVPDDPLAAVELERRVLRIGELPVVGIVHACAAGRHPRREVDTEREARDVDLVRAVVVDLAGPPAPEPVPVVVDVVVVIRRARRGTLPELVVEIGRHGDRLSLADPGARVGVPGTGEVGRSDDAVPDHLQRFDRSRRRTLLRPELHLAIVLLLRLDDELTLTRVVPGRLLAVDVFPRFQREDGHRDVPVVGRRDRDDIDVLVLECPTKVSDRLRLARCRRELLHPLGHGVRVDVAEVRDFGVLHVPAEVLHVDHAAPVHADDCDDQLLVR